MCYCYTPITWVEGLMRLNSKGQVTIPADVRHRHGLREGDEVDVVEDGNALRIVPVDTTQPRSAADSSNAGPAARNWAPMVSDVLRLARFGRSLMTPPGCYFPIAAMSLDHSAGLQPKTGITR
jgi:AbrB family looped-hinge helix DNA binding protein